MRFSIQQASQVPPAYVYHTPTSQQHEIRHDVTPQHRRRWFACCHFCCCSPPVSVIHPYLRPSAARVSTRQAVVRRIDDLLPTAALAVALAALEEAKRRDGLEDEMEENAPRV